MKIRLKMQLWACLSLLAFTSMTCEDLPDDDNVVTLSDIEVICLDNSGAYPKSIADGQCGREAFMLRVSPRFLYSKDGCLNDNSRLENEVIYFRITTVNDFNNEICAGSNVTTMFVSYPQSLVNGDCLSLPMTKWNNPLYLALVIPPDAGEHSFDVEMVLADDTRLSVRTQSVTFK